MQPQGPDLINTDQFTGYINQINSINTCAQLQSVVSDLIPSLNAQASSITQQIAVLAPMIALLTAPGANLTAIANYIESFIDNYLTQQLAPYVAYQTQATALAAQIATLTAAITSAAGRIPGCSITIP